MGRREIGLAVIGLFLGAAILIVLLAPRVTSTAPIESSETAWPEITIQFNQPIDEESFSGRFHITPVVDGQLLIEGDKALFRPAKALVYGQSYTVEIQPGVRGTNGLPLILGYENSFNITGPQLAYLREQDGSSILWARDGTGVLQPLTSAQDDVWDFEAVSEGRGILYSAADDTGGSDLWLLKTSGETELILDCQEDICLSAFWQPGGSLIAYERHPLDSGIDDIEVWLLDTNDGQTWRAYDTSLLGNAGFDKPTSHSPRWSADGRYLSLYKPDARVIVSIDMEGGPADFLPANLEIMGDWAPDDYQLAFSELVFGQPIDHEHEDEEGTVNSHTQPSLYNHTVLADFSLDKTTDISLGQEANDGQPAWHPAGDLLATGRTLTGGGRQIWLLPLDGSDAYSITDDPYYNHTAIAWSPDGRQLVYMRTGLVDASVPEIWLLDVETGQKDLVVKGGYIPKWLP